MRSFELELIPNTNELAYNVHLGYTTIHSNVGDISSKQFMYIDLAVVVDLVVVVVTVECCCCCSSLILDVQLQIKNNNNKMQK